MPERLSAAAALASVGEADLRKMARVAHLLDIGQPAFGTGQRPHRTRPGQGTEFLDFRGYRHGEDIRRLDWRVSARRGRPHVRTYHDELSADWQLCVDHSASMGAPDGRKWALAVQLAAAFAYMLLHAGNRVGLVLFSDRVDDLCPFGRGRLQYVRIADQLRDSRADTSGGGSALSSTTTVLRPGSHLAVLSDFLKPDAMQSDLEKLRSPGRRIHAVQILSPSETELGEPATRSVRDVETGERVAVDPGASRVALSALRRCQRDLEDFSVRSGIRLSSCSATDRWQDVMLRHIAVVSGA
jgi:uncharacterized protein (DUF58 family)